MAITEICDFKVTGDIFGFLSKYGMVPMYKKDDYKSIDKVFYTKDDIDCNIYKSSDVVKFINELTGEKSSYIFNEEMTISTNYLVNIETNSDLIAKKFLAEIPYNDKNRSGSVTITLGSPEEYTGKYGATKIYYNGGRFEGCTKEKCAISIYYRSNHEDILVRKLYLVYDKEKDQFIESINMWIDCKYSKVYNDSKLIKAQLQAEDGEVRLACRVLFKTVDLYYQFLKDAVEKKETYSIELNVMGKHLYDTLYGDKKVIGTCEECGATTAVTDDTPSNTENTEPVAVKVDESKLLEDDTPTIADASYIPKKFYRQTAGSYNDGK